MRGSLEATDKRPTIGLNRPITGREKICSSWWQMGFLRTECETSGLNPANPASPRLPDHAQLCRIAPDCRGNAQEGFERCESQRGLRADSERFPRGY